MRRWSTVHIGKLKLQWCVSYIYHGLCIEFPQNQCDCKRKWVSMMCSYSLPLSVSLSGRVVRRRFHDTIIHVITVRASLFVSLEIFDIRHCNYWNSTDDGYDTSIPCIKCVTTHVLLLILLIHVITIVRDVYSSYKFS